MKKHFFTYSIILIVIFLAGIIGVFLSPTSRTSYEFTLDNGLRVVAIPNNKVPAVTHMIWYNVGAADELEGKSGFAHLFEHLMFKNTKNLKSGEFSKLVAYYGGNDNAFTSQNYTAYYQTIAKEHLPLVMMMEAERMKNLQITKEYVEKERNIVLEERNMRVDNNPGALLSEKIKYALYPSHPYGTPVIGWRNEIEQLSAEDVSDFYTKYYAPNHATIVISGDIEILELKKLANKYYGSIAKSEKHNGRNNIRKMPTKVINHNIKHNDERVKNSQWIKTFQAPSATTGENQHAIPLVILAKILGGETGRLYQSLVVEQKIATSADVYYDEISYGPSDFSIYVTPAKNIKFIEIENAINVEINKIIEHGITNKELEHTKRSLTADFIYAKDGISSMAFIYGTVLASGLDRKYIEKWPKNVNKISKKLIINAAKYVFSSDNYVVGTLEPAVKRKRNIGL